VKADGTAQTDVYPAKHSNGKTDIISSTGTVSTTIGTGSSSGTSRSSKTLTAKELAALVTALTTKQKIPLSAGTYWTCTDTASYDRTEYTCT
jgi:hypothetical protein